MKILVFCKLFVIIVMLVDRVAGAPWSIFKYPYERLDVVDTTKDADVVVELLIVCDMDFVSHFKNSWKTGNITEFFVNQIWEVNNKFKTLSKTNIHIRVVDIVYIQTPKDQWFLKNIEVAYYTQPEAELLEGFSRWLYDKRMTLTPFDIAILTAGFPEKHYKNYVAHENTVCQVDDQMKLHKSSAIVFYKRRFHEPPHGLGNAIATLLYNSTYVDRNCSHKYRLVSYRSEYSIISDTIDRFYFSSCTDKAISSNLNRSESQCLLEQNPDSIDILSNYSGIVPPTFDAQCHRYFQSQDYTSFDRYTVIPCKKIYCGHKTRYGGSYLRPSDNTPCGMNANCFRGRCLLQGFQLQSLLRNKCMTIAVDLFHNPQPKFTHTPLPLSNCVDTRALNIVRIEKFSNQGSRIFVTSYIFTELQKTHDYCFAAVDQSVETVFEKCSDSHSQLWKFVKAKNGGREFLLYAVTKKVCLKSIGETADCDANDPDMLWKFYGENVPEEFLNNLLDSHSNITQNSKTQDSEVQSSKIEDSESQDSEPEDYEPEDYEPEDYEPEDYEPEDYEPEDHEPEDYEPEDSEPEDYEPANSEPQDLETQDTKMRDSDEQKSNTEDSEPQNSESQDSKMRDSDEQESGTKDSEKQGSKEQYGCYWFKYMWFSEIFKELNICKRILYFMQIDNLEQTIRSNVE